MTYSSVTVNIVAIGNPAFPRAHNAYEVTDSTGQYFTIQNGAKTLGFMPRIFINGWSLTPLQSAKLWQAKQIFTETMGLAGIGWPDFLNKLDSVYLNTLLEDRLAENDGIIAESEPSPIRAIPALWPGHVLKEVPSPARRADSGTHKTHTYDFSEDARRNPHYPFGPPPRRNWAMTIGFGLMAAFFTAAMLIADYMDNQIYVPNDKGGATYDILRASAKPEACGPIVTKTETGTFRVEIPDCSFK